MVIGDVEIWPNKHYLDHQDSARYLVVALVARRLIFRSETAQRLA